MGVPPNHPIILVHQNHFRPIVLGIHHFKKPAMERTYRSSFHTMDGCDIFFSVSSIQDRAEFLMISSIHSITSNVCYPLVI